MTFAQVGTYTFNVSEDKGTEAGMSYDADVKTLTVTVTDQGGKLVAVPEGDLSFTNTYTASGSYTPQGTSSCLATRPSLPLTKTMQPLKSTQRITSRSRMRLLMFRTQRRALPATPNLML